MKTTNRIPKNLIAPCGMNCAICSRYLAYSNKLKRSQCPGCRPGNRTCSYLFGKCTGINSRRKGNANAPFCFTCDQYPCKEIERMDVRYRTNYGMSVKENLSAIKRTGVERFAKAQYREHCCARCNGLRSVHNGKCFHCDTITRLVEKRGRTR